MRIALYQPDQPGNVGAILRLGACFGVPVDIIEPCGFAFGDRALNRAGMDYVGQVEVRRHANWDAFVGALPGRLALFTTRGGTALPRTRFAAGDTLLFGSESSGAPDLVHQRADLAVRIPLKPGLRSLNVAITAGIGLAEALRQTDAWPTR